MFNSFNLSTLPSSPEKDLKISELGKSQYADETNQIPH
jgi:hypothetical protein